MYRRCSTLLLIVGFALIEADLFQDDGVLVEEQGTVRTISGLWTVMIVLHPPTRPNTTSWTEHLRLGIEKAGRQITKEDKLMWLTRMAALRAKREVPLDVWAQRAAAATPTGGRTRVRRGLFDFVGKLGRSLFGTATVDEVRALRALIRHNQENQAILRHNEREMVSVVNQTRRYVRENRLDLQQVRAETIHLHDLATATAKETQALQLYRGRAQIRRRIDLALQQMELAMQDYRLQERIFHRQKLQLERGWLTEDILTPNSMTAILRTLANTGHHTLPAVWYYQYLRVTPVWGSPTELGFRVVIPALAKTHYLKFGLRYFKVPVGTNQLRQLVGRDSLAINTLTGTTFTPHDCAGSAPMLCDPTYETLVPTCEGALVTGRQAPDCRVIITPRRNATSEVFRLSDRTTVAVVAYTPTEVTTRCPGLPPQRQTVQGPQRVPIPDNCLLETDSWRVSSMRKGHRSLNLVPPVYAQVPRLNITWPRSVPPYVLDKLKWNDRAEVPLVDLHRFTSGKDKVLPSWTELRDLSYRYGGPVLVVLVGGMVVAIVVCIWRRRRLRSRYGRTLEPSAPVATTFVARDIDMPAPLCANPYKEVAAALRSLQDTV